LCSNRKKSNKFTSEESDEGRTNARGEGRDRREGCPTPPRWTKGAHGETWTTRVLSTKRLHSLQPFQAIVGKTSQDEILTQIAVLHTFLHVSVKERFSGIIYTASTHICIYTRIANIFIMCSLCLTSAEISVLCYWTNDFVAL
jgi:hypothetical protein